MQVDFKSNKYYENYFDMLEPWTHVKAFHSGQALFVLQGFLFPLTK